MYSGYVAGGNAQFFGASRAPKNAAGTLSPTFANKIESMTERLSFDNEEGDYESMLAFACKWNDGSGRRDQVMSLSDRVLPWEVSRPVDEQHSYFPGGVAGYKLYYKLLQLGQIHFGERGPAAEPPRTAPPSAPARRAQGRRSAPPRTRSSWRTAR